MKTKYHIILILSSISCVGYRLQPLAYHPEFLAGKYYQNYSKGFLVADSESEDTKVIQSNDDTDDEDSEDDDDTDESEQEIKLTDNQISEDLKKGRACAQSILGIIATGDASIEEAKLDAGIKKVSTVSHETFSVVSLYAQICTVVAGI